MSSEVERLIESTDRGLMEMAFTCSVDMTLWGRFSNNVLATLRALATSESNRLQAERERDEARKWNGHACERIAQLEGRFTAAEALAEARLEALNDLSGYAQHDNDCAANLNAPCDCGYSDASRRAALHAQGES